MCARVCSLRVPTCLASPKPSSPSPELQRDEHEEALEKARGRIQALRLRVYILEAAADPEREAEAEQEGSPPGEYGPAGRLGLVAVGRLALGDSAGAPRNR